MTYFLKKKKWMAWVVLLTFLFTSFMPSNILAGNSVAEAATSGTSNSTPSETTYSAEDITLTKTAVSHHDKNEDPDSSVADGNCNLYDVTLSVQGKEVVTGGKKVDVILVLDNSNSMYNNGTTRASDTKNAADAFVDAVLTEANTLSGNVRVGVVRYGTDAYAYQYNNSSWSKWSSSQSLTSSNVFTSDNTKAKAAISSALTKFSSESNGGTNTEGGFLEAQKLAALKRSDADCIVIFMTDGLPTYRYEDMWNTPNAQSTNDTSGSKTSKQELNEAIEAAQTLAGMSGVEVYTVGLLNGFTKDSNEAKLAENLLGMNPKEYTSSKNISDILGKTNNWASTDCYTQAYYPVYSGDNAASKMSNIYNGLASEINALAIGTVTDIIPAGFALTAESKVALEEKGVAVTENENGSTTLVFSDVTAGKEATILSYTVKNTENRYGVAFTNSSAVYAFTPNTDSWTGDVRPKEFPKPSVVVCATAKDDAAYANIGIPVTIDIARNDDYSKIAEDGYSVSDLAYVFFADGVGITANENGEYTVDGGIFKLVNGNVVFTADDTIQGKDVSFSYALEGTATKGGVSKEVYVHRADVTITVHPSKELTVTKQWKNEDETDIESNLPGVVQVTLHAKADLSGEELTAEGLWGTNSEITLSAALTADNSWRYSWTVPESINGKSVTYWVTEETVPNGYNVSYSPAYPGGSASAVVSGAGFGENGYATVVNTYTGGEKTSVGINKRWVDPEGTEHPTITINLLQNGEQYGSIQLQNGSVNHTFTDLPLYTTKGESAVYTVSEDLVDGYTMGVITGDASTGYTITNTIEQDNSVEVSGNKTWIDPEGTEHPIITINLLRDGEEVDSTTLANGETSYSFSNLLKYDLNDGHEYAYTVEEEAVEGYTSVQNGTDFTNTIAQETITISGTKIWNVPEDIEVPAQIEVQLFRDNSEEPIETAKVSAPSADDLIWPYKFTDLEKYNLKDGHAYVYTVEEVPVEGFTTSYNGFDIINTYDRSATTSVHVEKVWNDFGANVGEHPAVTIQLYQGDLLYDTLELSEKNGWNATFADLKQYDANQQPYEYTVQEVPVSGYESSVEETADGFVITNTLLMAEPGKVTVGKTATGDNKPDTDTRYKFELQIQVVRPEGSNVLFDARALSNVTLADAANRLNEAIDAVEDSAVLVTSSSQYQYFLTEKENAFAAEANTLMAVEYHHTSPSAIVFENGQGPVVSPSDLEEEEADYFLALRATIVRELLKLSASYTADEVGELVVELAENVPLEVEDGYGFAMDQAAVEALIAAVYDYNAAAGTLPEPAPSEAPLALQVFLNGSSTPSALTFVENGETGNYYKVDFWLASGANAVFDIQATSGSAIYYRIVESFDGQTSANHSYTNIFDAVTGQTTSGTAIDFTLFDESAAMAYSFTNVYTNNTNDGGNTGDGDNNEDEDPVTPPSGGGDGYDGPYSDDDTIIDDEEVPLAEPDVDDTDDGIEIDDEDVPLTDVPGEALEIDDEQVPLGDAPKTGDANNAIPFVVLMMMAGLGLAVTRRKFN